MPSVQLFMAAAFYLHGEHPDIFCAVCCLSLWNFVYDFGVFFFSCSFLLFSLSLSLSLSLFLGDCCKGLSQVTKGKMILAV